jgi:hypothetical protein
MLPFVFAIDEPPQKKHGFYVPTICSNLCFKALANEFHDFTNWD